MNRLTAPVLSTPRFTAFACAALCTLMTVAGIDALALAETAPLWLAHAGTDTATQVATSAATSAAASAAPLGGA